MFLARAAVAGVTETGVKLAHALAAGGVSVVLAGEGAAAGRDQVGELAAQRLQALVERGRLSEEDAAAQRERTLELISARETVEGLAGVQIAIECSGEDPERCRAALAALDAAAPGGAVLASAAASVSIEELAEAVTRPELLVGFRLAPSGTLAEVVEGADSDPEAIAVALALAYAARLGAVRVLDSPAGVVNRLLLAAHAVLWRAIEADDLEASAALAEAPRAPVEAERIAAVLAEAYGERFRPPVAASAGGTKPPGALSELVELAVLAEACLILEEGVCSAREIELAAAAAGLRPPLAQADATGLDVLLGRLEDPPVILRRLHAQGRLGAAAGQGFFAYPRPDAAHAEGPVKLELRGAVAIAWIDNPPANAITIEVTEALAGAWEHAREHARVLILASAHRQLFCAGADIKSFVTMDAQQRAGLVERMQSLLLQMGRSGVVTIAAVNGLAYGGGCEIAMGMDIRLAARSASFAQPEIKLGIVPGFGATQRLARLVGSARALELNLSGEPIDALEAWELGLVNRVVPDHELFDTALNWAERFAHAPRAAVEEIKRLAAGAELEAGIELEKAAFERVFATADAREGIAAFIAKRAPRFAAD
jgi:enoyl-CoA hydratase/3-hydroxyacyl-CoA dehydrogenase